MRTASLILISLGISIGASLTASAQAGNDFAITGHSKLNAEDKGKDEKQLRRDLDVLTKPCLVNGPNEGYQLWRVVSPANSFASFKGSSGDGNCLASARPKSCASLPTDARKTAPGGSTLFVLQLAADLTCKTDCYFHICFTD